MTEPIEIDQTRALALLREVVDEHGRDHTYTMVLRDSESLGQAMPMCVYADNGAPSCLVGHALHRAGVTVDELDNLTGTITGAILPERVRLTQGAFEVLHAAQAAQDEQETWGYALERAQHVAHFEAGDDQ